MFLNLVGEVGEFASKVAKAIRKEKITIGGDFHYENNHLNDTIDSNNEELYAELSKEAGDVLWQLSGLCTVMGWSLEEDGIVITNDEWQNYIIPDVQGEQKSLIFYAVFKAN